MTEHFSCHRSSFNLYGYEDGKLLNGTGDTLGQRSAKWLWTGKMCQFPKMKIKRIDHQRHVAQGHQNHDDSRVLVGLCREGQSIYARLL